MASYKGVGKTLDEATRKAQDQIPAAPDEEIISRVTQWGLRSGSITGLAEFYVVVEQIKSV
jgi:hypothetical protein